MNELYLITSDGQPIYLAATHAEAVEWQEHEIRHHAKETAPTVRIHKLDATDPTAEPPTVWYISLHQSVQIAGDQS